MRADKKVITFTAVSILAYFCLLVYYDFEFISFLCLSALIVMIFVSIRQIKNLKFDWLKFIGAILLSSFWMASTYNTLPKSVFLDILVLIGTFYFYLMLFYLLLMELSSSFKYQHKIPPRKIEILILAFIPAIVWFFSFLAYFPGRMTFDSFYQWAMAHGVRGYTEWHPMLHTLWIKAAASIYNSPASYILSQIIVVALILGYSGYTLMKLHAPRFLVYILILMFALWPVMMIYSVVMWKDIPFAAFILLFTILTMKIIYSDGNWIKNKWHTAGFIFVAFVTMNLRNNGSLVIIISLICFILFMKHFRIRFSLILVGVFVLNIIFSGFLAFLHVQKIPLNQALAIPSQQIGAVFYYEGNVSPELQTYFTKILPAKDWKKDYNPYTVDPIKHDNNYNAREIEDDFGLYIKNWAKLMKDNFGIYVTAYLDQVRVIWKYQSPADYHVFFSTIRDISDIEYDTKAFAQIKTGNRNDVERMNKIGYEVYKKDMKAAHLSSNLTYNQFVKERVDPSVKPLHGASKLPGYSKFLDDLFERITTDWQDVLLKGAIPLLALLIAFVSILEKGNKKKWLIFVPIFMTCITIAIAMPATDFRYSFSFIFTVPFIFFLGKMSLNNEENFRRLK